MVRKENRKPITVLADGPVLVDGVKYHSVLGGLAKDYQLGQDPSIKDNAKMGELVFLVAGYSQKVFWDDEEMSRQVFYNDWMTFRQEYAAPFTLELKPEPENPYDPNAINILFRINHEFWIDFDKFSVGYVPKRIAYYLRQNLASIKKIDVADLVQMQNEDLAFHIRITYNNEYLDESQDRISKRFSRILR